MQPPPSPEGRGQILTCLHQDYLLNDTENQNNGVGPRSGSGDRNQLRRGVSAAIGSPRRLFISRRSLSARTLMVYLRYPHLKTQLLDKVKTLISF